MRIDVSNNRFRNEIGAGVIEYGVLVALIALVALGAIPKVSRATKQKFCVMGTMLAHGGGNITSGDEEENVDARGLDTECKQPDHNNEEYNEYPE